VEKYRNPRATEGEFVSSNYERVPTLYSKNEYKPDNYIKGT
jgi:hypothetical protein